MEMELSGIGRRRTGGTIGSLRPALSGIGGSRWGKKTTSKKEEQKETNNKQTNKRATTKGKRGEV